MNNDNFDDVQRRISLAIIFRRQKNIKFFIGSLLSPCSTYSSPAYVTLSLLLCSSVAPLLLRCSSAPPLFLCSSVAPLLPLRCSSAPPRFSCPPSLFSRSPLLLCPRSSASPLPLAPLLLLPCFTYTPALLLPRSSPTSISLISPASSMLLLLLSYSSFLFPAPLLLQLLLCRHGTASGRYCVVRRRIRKAITSPWRCRLPKTTFSKW